MLLKIVETQLQETQNMREKTPDFIRKVVHLYTLQLMKTGTIPLEFMEDVLTDIEAEAIEIYRKKTYGFLTLEEYRKHKFRQKDDN
ncbi:putative DNA-dependent DNA polymerase [Bdellovibrio bacteriovorus str. Tiberius]|uniref:Putative DNA-dependent DNA polymerase n=2 Tax=Bdellovibrio bacteriovorus TaxID=959 RepID=K7YLL2_BDEBC|nr:putative DNA-dependent DNA polymerase [Bdellovibrio bacteriovorus str. Tiberius]